MAARRDPVDAAISQRAARLLQEERGRMAPVWTSGLESTVPPANAEVEAMCASLLEDAQTAKASAAAVRQRAMAGAQEHGPGHHLPHTSIYAAEEAAYGLSTDEQTVSAPVLELLSDDSDSDDADGGLEDDAIRAMESGTVLGLCGNGHISDYLFRLIQRPREQGGHVVCWETLTVGAGMSRSGGGHVVLADVSAVVVDDEFCALHLESVYPDLPALSVQAYHFQEFQHWRVGLLALLHAHQVSETHLPSVNAIDTSYAHSWVVSLDGEEIVANTAAGEEHTQMPVFRSACNASKPNSVT